VGLRLTFEEYKRLAQEAHGRKSGPRLPGKMRPYDVLREAVEAFIKERQREQDRAYRANKRAKEKSEQAALNALDDKESVILTFVQQHPDKQHSIDDIGQAVKRSRLFRKMKPESRKNAIRRILLEKLLPYINVTEASAKNRGSKIMAQIKKQGN
jgi:hypothetical protein